MLARQPLRELIYAKTGYSLADKWRQFHDRMLLNDVEDGYFSVFREIADIILAAIQHGLYLDAHTMPDISVGQAWSKTWVSRRLEDVYGARRSASHFFPDYFPQPGAVPVWVYPLAALGEFRLWLQSEYLPKKYPTYLRYKVRKGLMSEAQIEPLLDAVSKPRTHGDGPRPR